MSKYFSPSEFRACSPSCRIEQMNPAFLDTLDRIREAAGIPMVLTCAFRSKQWDISKGRTGNSAHTRGLAVDVRCSSNANRYKIIRAAIACGITRIGIGKNFIHIDADPSLTHERIWHYYD